MANVKTKETKMNVMRKKSLWSEQIGRAHV